MTEENINNTELTSIESSNPETSESWLDNLPKEMKENESLGKFKDIPSLAQSYIEAEKSLSSRVAIPADGADEEEWSKLYKRLGVPDDKKYKEDRNPEDEEYLKDYEEMFYNSGITKRQGEKLLTHFYDYSDNLQEKNRSELDKVKQENLGWLKSNYGDNFDSRMTQMQAAVKEFGSKELLKMVEDSVYAPALVDMLVRVGETLKSDALVTGNEKAPISSKEQALKEIKKLESNPGFMVQLSDKNHVAHTLAVEKMKELHDLAYSS